MMLNHRWLRDDIQELVEKRVFAKEDCKNMMKVMIRSGFELVMEREGQYTPDLFLCYHTFYRCTHYYLNPVESFMN